MVSGVNLTVCFFNKYNFYELIHFLDLQLPSSKKITRAILL